GVEFSGEEGDDVWDRLGDPVARVECQPGGSPLVIGEGGEEGVVMGPAVSPQEKDGAERRVEPIRRRRGGGGEEGQRRTWPIDVGDREEIVPVRARIL